MGGDHQQDSIGEGIRVKQLDQLVRIHVLLAEVRIAFASIWLQL